MSDRARFILLIAAYMAAHAWLRVASSPTLDLDEAEQVVLAQQFQWGYGGQAPLFTWLQTLLIRAMGPNVLPLALLKSALLAAIFAVAYAIAQHLFTGSRRAAAAASLFLLPYLVYQSLRDSSHSIILTLACALCLWLILRLGNRRNLPLYVALGLCVAAGSLSKYNFALFLIPAAIATVAVPEFRPIARDTRLLLAAAIAIALFTPHGLWMAANFDAATAESIEKLKAKEIAPLRSLAKLAECLIRFSGVALIAAGIALPQILRRQAGAPPPSPARRWFAWFFAAGLIGLVLMMVATGATDLSERWLLPLLFCLPIALYLRARDPSAAAERRFACGIGIAAVAVPIALGTHALLGPALGHPLRKNLDFSPIPATRTDVPGSIIAQNFFLAGNLRRLYPTATVHVPARTAQPAATPRPIWIVWQSKSSGFRRAVTEATGIPWDQLQPEIIELPYFPSAPIDPARVSIATVPKAPRPHRKFPHE